MWTFEVVGRKFEQQINPLDTGVFNSTKNYFVVCKKDTRIAIFLWRGEKQTLLKWHSVFELFCETRFKYISNSLRDKVHKQRAVSEISTTGLLKQDTKIGDKKDDSYLDDPNLKYTFRPLDLFSQNCSQSEVADNLCPVRKGEYTHMINLRSVVVMDNEPQHFL